VRATEHHDDQRTKNHGAREVGLVGTQVFLTCPVRTETVSNEQKTIRRMQKSDVDAALTHDYDHESRACVQLE
jgi:hypothetical protein